MVTAAMLRWLRLTKQQEGDDLDTPRLNQFLCMISNKCCFGDCTA